MLLGCMKPVGDFSQNSQPQLQAALRRRDSHHHHHHPYHPSTIPNIATGIITIVTLTVATTFQHFVLILAVNNVNISIITTNTPPPDP